ncbi:tyrosine/nicotianamine aminotransferase, Pyridoxal phosphate-dependent transferase [Artemisia annua]|uniref:Tyrosine/nicotianamine aminotransferase, Pyridoxal phosphate-dependent transferase n=1 Tax=Artemisia annua TaxID=35608 RepID=A0A2U1N610_ARTAN|nr:tyrosine/nicotianamine aminotransferase, Pyridoxal phosphate-dependent transferase [Artemisia annua]
MSYILTVLARHGANILLPRPNYPTYEARAKFCSLEVRHFDLLPEKGWEVDIDRVKALTDAKTVAIVLVNPGNPCGNIFTFEHMKKFMPISSSGKYHSLPCMGVFRDIVPVVTHGTLSKRWIIPGWHFGWIAITDRKRILHKTGIVDSIKSCLVITGEPPHCYSATYFGYDEIALPLSIPLYRVTVSLQPDLRQSFGFIECYQMQYEEISPLSKRLLKPNKSMLAADDIHDTPISMPIYPSLNVGP